MLSNLLQNLTPDYPKPFLPQNKNGSSSSARQAPTPPINQANPDEVQRYNQPSLTATKSSQIKAMEQQSLSLGITTLEGDQIEINLSLKNSSSQDFSSKGSFQQFSSHSFLALEINGELSDQERVDLDQLIQEVEQLAQQFYNGNLADAFAMASSLNIDGSTLANFSLNLHSSASLSAIERYRSTAEQPRLAPPLMEQMANYIEALQNSYTKASQITEPQSLLTPLFEWLSDSTNNSFAAINQQLLDKLQAKPMTERYF